MEVSRIDIFDFKVILSEVEFRNFKVMSVKYNCSMEFMLQKVLVARLLQFNVKLEGKRGKNVVD